MINPAAKMLKKITAEFIGTFGLVLFGTGAIVLDAAIPGTIGNAGIAAAFGLAVALMILLLGGISGSLINPAVTLVFMVSGKIPNGQGLYYIIAQVTGASCASLLLHAWFPFNRLLGSTMPSGSPLQSFALEAGLTCLLMLIILRITAVKNIRSYIVAIIVGAVVWFEAYFAGPVCGASMNPARSIGPALVSGHTENLWIYIFAPCIGALLAHALDMACFKKSITLS